MRYARLAVLAAAAALIASAAGASTALGAGWAKVSGDDVSSIDQAPVVIQSGRVVTAWPSGAGTDLAGAVAFRGFAPTPAAPLAGASPIATATSGYSSISQRPGLVATPAGVQLVTGGVIAGQSRAYLTPPLAEGAPGGGASVIADTSTGTLDALLVPPVGTDPGGIIVANTGVGTLHTFRGPVANEGFEVSRDTYHPALARDGAGRVWLAYYAAISGAPGIYLVELNPLTGEPGTPVRVPQSQSPYNNGFHLALACSPIPAGGCRILYLAETTPGQPLRLATWAPDQPSAPPVTVLPAGPNVTATVTAAYRADGRLWIAWFDNTKASYYARLGSATGAGGVAQKLGKPPRLVDERNLESVAFGNDLVLVGTVVTTAVRASLWTNYVQDPSQIIENPRTIRNGPAKVVAPKGVSLKKLKRAKCVRVRVSVSEPARVLVAIFSGPKSRRLFGQKILAFTKAPATRITCVTVPFRAKTFDPRAPAGIIVAVRKGAARGSSGPPAKVVTKGFRFF